MTHRIHLLGALALGGALLSIGCGKAVNLMNADGPQFLGNYAPADTSARPRSAPIRVVTFNIKESKEIDRAIAVLESDSLRGADVVALQEMDESGVDRIARALNLNYAYYPAVIHPKTNGYYGPAVLTRWPIERSWKVILPHEAWGRKQQRTATAAVVRINGLPVAVYAVHLETMVKLSDASRTDQANAVTNDAKRYTGPVVILGDFNDYAMAARMEQQGFTWPTEWLGPTHMGLFTLDHIMTRGLAPVTPASVGVVHDVWGASDHHPVWAVLAPAPASLSARTTLPDRETSGEVAGR
jgi:endonuclease/exonuclease/phosphatase family metal-dependent hydrolase